MRNLRLVEYSNLNVVPRLTWHESEAATRAHSLLAMAFDDEDESRYRPGLH